jgi:hypothetical protein
MPKYRRDTGREVRDVLRHVEILPPEAATPAVALLALSNGPLEPVGIHRPQGDEPGP